MTRRTIRCVVAVGTVILLAACGQAPTPTLLPTSVAAPPAAGGDIYRPIADAECSALQQDLAALLGVQVEKATGPFHDYATGQQGTGCLLEAHGTGVDFGSERAVTSNLQFLLEDGGWVIDLAYVAGGPTGTAFGLRRDNSLVLANVMWTPSADAKCPAGQPRSACNLKPEQMLYTITVQVAEK